MSATAVVIDASVVFKWLVSEDGSEAAIDLLARQERGELLLVAPRQAAAEVASVLVRRTRRDLLTPAIALEQFSLFLDRIDSFEHAVTLDTLAMRLALSSGQSLYDCLYLALALQMGCDLITADQRFYRALHPRFSCLRLLPE